MKPYFVTHWLICAIVLAIIPSVSRAMGVQFAGFGTASVGCFTNNTAQFVINDQPEGPGRNRRCDAGTDSLLGLQVDLNLLESLEIGVQVVADRNADRDYLPGFMVAQLRWHPTDDLTLRLGRMPTPAFLYSESRQVRYAMPWVRPPIEVYGLFPTFSHDGIELIHNSRFGHWNAEWHGGFSRIEFDSPVSNSKDTIPVKTYGGFINLSIEKRATLIKLGYLYNQVSFSFPNVDRLFEALQSSLPQGEQLVKDLAIDESPMHLLSLGMRHEFDDWLIIGEVSYRTMQGFFRNQYGAYISLGRRFDDWMPYATLARRWTSGPNTDSRAGFFQSQVSSVLTSSRFDTTSVALGISRDLTEQIKLKLQTDWIQPDGNSWGLYTNHVSTYNYSNPKSDWLFSLSVDFVF
ncbi:MAG: hypothetical protein ACU836_14785 [Gammaproteobacteria bacterium]